MKVLVTGGNGFIGKNLQAVRPDWAYVSSQDYNLVSQDECLQMFKDIDPEAVIHLAARVGGIKENSENQADFFHKNVTINNNVLHCAYLSGVNRVLSSLSTGAFPNVVSQYPFCEENLFDGPPAPTNFSYGFSKRMLHVQSISYREQYGLNFSTFCPSNLYGPEDHFDTESSHFVASLISKVARSNSGDIINLWGKGKPFRQQLFSSDLCKIIPKLLDSHNTKLPIIVAPDQNLSIEEMANFLIKASGKNLKVKFNQNLDGQFRKDGSNKRLRELIDNFKFTSFEKGVNETYEWYCGRMN